MKSESASLRLVRSIAAGVILSMLFFYGVHVYGKWETENYRPDSQTTSTLLLHNTCAVFNKLHTLRPNTDVSGLGAGIDGTKLSGSFMNFTDGHVLGMVILAIVIGFVVFAIRHAIRQHRHPNHTL
ncbi:MAG TPA: hypothetical protein VM884_09415 [Flavisolibacter sp.]|jgi:hypothetical protein|nr:hypothetical protein [Flavisolibacter sp.]